MKAALVTVLTSHQTYGWKAVDILRNLQDLIVVLADREAADKKVIGPMGHAFRSRRRLDQAIGLGQAQAQAQAQASRAPS